MRWGDVDWARGRIRVRSPKTEHHEGGGSRIVPIFPELRPHLESAFDEAEPGTEYVIANYRESDLNLRSRLLDIIWSAGLKEWPTLFQNMRSTRETELAESFPLHVVCKWIGNSQPVAEKHYLQVTDEHFDRAIRGDGSAAQNPAQSTNHDRRNQSNRVQLRPRPQSRDAVHGPDHRQACGEVQRHDRPGRSDERGGQVGRGTSDGSVHGPEPDDVGSVPPEGRDREAGPVPRINPCRLSLFSGLFRAVGRTGQDGEDYAPIDDPFSDSGPGGRHEGNHPSPPPTAHQSRVAVGRAARAACESPTYRNTQVAQGTIQSQGAGPEWRRIRAATVGRAENRVLPASVYEPS
jgi:hypothetical protein